jgi:hypothetical protein
MVASGGKIRCIVPDQQASACASNITTPMIRYDMLKTGRYIRATVNFDYLIGFLIAEILLTFFLDV